MTARKYAPRSDHYPSQAALKRVADAARAIGLTIVGVEVPREGVIKVLDQAAIAVNPPKDKFDKWLASGKLG